MPSRYWRAVHGCLWLLTMPAIGYAAHPLTTDDTNTQGAGRHQLEFVVDYARDSEGDSSERGYVYAVTWSYGLRDNVDLILALPYLSLRTESGGEITKANGLSDTGLAVKWRFYEDGPFSLAFKPGVTLTTGDEDKGLGAENSIYTATLVASFAQEDWEWHGHASYIYNRNSQEEREDLYLLSTAGGWKPTEQLKLVAEVGMFSIADKTETRNPWFMTVGLIYAVSKDLDLDIGYKRGLTDNEIDYTWQAGVTVRF